MCDPITLSVGTLAAIAAGTAAVGAGATAIAMSGKKDPPQVAPIQGFQTPEKPKAPEVTARTVKSTKTDTGAAASTLGLDDLKIPRSSGISSSGGGSGVNLPTM